jgi:hypothetical protein
MGAKLFNHYKKNLLKPEYLKPAYLDLLLSKPFFVFQLNKYSIIFQINGEQKELSILDYLKDTYSNIEEYKYVFDNYEKLINIIKIKQEILPKKKYFDLVQKMSETKLFNLELEIFSDIDNELFNSLKNEYLNDEKSYEESYEEFKERCYPIVKNDFEFNLQL